VTDQAPSESLWSGFCRHRGVPKGGIARKASTEFTRQAGPNVSTANAAPALAFQRRSSGSPDALLAANFPQLQTGGNDARRAPAGQPPYMDLPFAYFVPPVRPTCANVGQFLVSLLPTAKVGGYLGEFLLARCASQRVTAQSP
jgi:hypothetical protein